MQKPQLSPGQNRARLLDEGRNKFSNWSDDEIRVALKTFGSRTRTRLYTVAVTELERRGYSVEGTSAKKIVDTGQPALIPQVELIDLVNQPPHYTHAAIEVIDLIEIFNLDFREGSAVKYILRWRHKGGIQDLEKAIWYIRRIIAHEQEGPGSTAPRDLKEELSRARGLGGEDPEPVVTPESRDAHRVRGNDSDWATPPGVA